VLIALLEELRGRDLPGTVHAAVSVQEEVGMRGARMLAERLRPDYAVAVDTIPTDDVREAGQMALSHLALGRGPVVQMMEGIPGVFLGTISHRAVTGVILKTAGRLGIPVQRSALYGFYTTDAAAVHIAGAGIPTGMVSIPRRYAHSPVEVVNLNDAVHAVHLLRAMALEGLERSRLRFAPDL